MFVSILQGHVALPVERFDEHDKKLLPQDHKRFMSLLLKWWSGSQNYVYKRHYSIVPTRVRNPGQLPVAHTCSFQIDIPEDIADANEMMYRLLKAMINT